MPVPQQIILLVEQASCLLLEKLLGNAAKYQIKHSYSLFLLPSSFFPLPSSFFAMVLKRYTPPTCTLEITAKSSPLSRWAGKPVFKSLNFELRLDDPRLPDTQHVTLRGDRVQLETLHQAVSNYVQNFLGESRDWESNLNSQTGLTAAGPDSPEAARHAVIFDRSVNSSELATPAPNTSYLRVPPRLEPRGLLAHNLFLGSLSAAESAPTVNLSTLQLFDLAAALDDCAAEVMALPNLDRAPRRPKALPWLNLAAMLVAMAGLTTGIIKMLYRPATEAQTATAPAAAPPAPKLSTDPAQPQLAAGASPSPVAPLPTPPSSNTRSSTRITAPTAPAHQHRRLPQPQLAPHRPRPNTTHQQTQPHSAATPTISPQQQRPGGPAERPSPPSRTNNHNS